MEILKIIIWSYLIIGIFNMFMTGLMLFNGRNKHEHKLNLIDKWKMLWNMPKIGKPLAILTILISIVWLIIGWPYTIITGYRNIGKNGN